MATQQNWLYSSEDLTKVANDVKDVLLVRMAKDGILTSEQVDDFRKSYIITVAKIGWFSHLFRAVKDYDAGKDPYRFIVSRMITDDDDSDKRISAGKVMG